MVDRVIHVFALITMVLIVFGFMVPVSIMVWRDLLRDK